MHRSRNSLLAAALVAACWTAHASDWPQWRGPNFNGSSDEKGLPADWKREDAAWSADLPGASASTPVVLGDKIFVSTVNKETSSLHALCFDRRSGKLLWDKSMAEGAVRRDDMSDFASSSPVASPDKVFFFFANGVLSALDHAGAPVWSRDLVKEFGEWAYQWTYSSSPMLYGGRLYVQVLQRDVPVHGHGRTDGPIESYVIAIDPATGRTLWRTVRPNAAVAESKEAYSTPLPFTFEGRTEIIISGGDCLTGYDPATGAELWRWGTWNPQKISHWRLVPSPVAGGGVVLAPAPKGDPIYAVKLGGKGELGDDAVAWRSDGSHVVSTDVPTPLFYDGDFFVLGDGKRVLLRLDPKTGAEKWRLQLPGRAKFEASPLGADGKVYTVNFSGEVTVADAGKGTILSTVAMGDQGDNATRPSVVAASGHLIIRTNHKLWSIGPK
jgi:outer membrane protein assembly factor BamB